MKNLKRKVDKKELELSISTLYPTRASRATLPHPGYYPTLLKNNDFLPRDSWKNVLLGTTVTNPTSGRYLLGISYWDIKENKDNEDLFEIDMANETIVAGYRGLFDKNDPLYKGTHKDGKTYFMTPRKKTEILFKKYRYKFGNLFNHKI